MATDTRALPSQFTSDAAFRNWGSGLAAQFAAIGLVKTSDTGQIDWSTVLKPTTSGQSRGYEIWRFNDALQATAPVFIRFDYGSSTQSTVIPMLNFTIGTGTDGAGTLTGQVGATKFGSVAGFSGLTTPNSYCSGSPSRLHLATNMDLSSANYPIIVCIERTKTADGVNTADAVIRQGGTQFQTARFQLVPFFGVIPAELSTGANIGIYDGANSMMGLDVMLSPPICFWGRPLYGSWLMYRATDIPGTDPITVTYLGAPRTYLPLGAAGVIGGSLGSSMTYAILWE